MTQDREIAVQRIQVGVVGLVIVLLFVSLANMLLDRAVDAGVAASDGGDAALVEAMGEKEAAPDDPLTELGVAPKVETEAEAQAKSKTEALEAAPEQNNVKTTE